MEMIRIKQSCICTKNNKIILLIIQDRVIRYTILVKGIHFFMWQYPECILYKNLLSFKNQRGKYNPPVFETSCQLHRRGTCPKGSLDNCLQLEGNSPLFSEGFRCPLCRVYVRYLQRSI